MQPEGSFTNVSHTPLKSERAPTFPISARGRSLPLAGQGLVLPLRVLDGSYERRCRPWRSGSMRQCRPEPCHGNAGAIASRRFLVNTVTSRTGSSMPSPTNQRNRKL
jgi:hypothetical protein